MKGPLGLVDLSSLKIFLGLHVEALIYQSKMSLKIKVPNLDGVSFFILDIRILGLA
jgi:hypothetical protein